MRTVFLSLLLLGGAYVYVLLETENRRNIQTPAQQKRITEKRQQRRRRKQNALAYATNNNMMAIGKENGELKIWYGSTGGQSHLLQINGSPIVFLTFSEDENWLLSLDDRGITQLWNTDTGEISKTLIGLAEKGFPNRFSEFIEVNPVYECLVFRQQSELIYYSYITEELSNQPPIQMVNY